jgi:hypothetical protein
MIPGPRDVQDPEHSWDGQDVSSAGGATPKSPLSPGLRSELDA